MTIFFGGLFLSWFGRYNPILWAGYGIYLIGAGLQTLFKASTSKGYIIGILVVEGFGMGWTLQTSLVAMQANAAVEDRAVVTGIRNIARCVGGSFGLAICSGILSNSIPEDDDMGNSAPGSSVLKREQDGLEKIWWFLFAIGVVVFIAGFGVEEVDLESQEPGEMPLDTVQAGRHSGIELSQSNIERRSRVGGDLVVTGPGTAEATGNNSVAS